MRVGILGGGQLARMLALAGYPLGLQFVVLCPAGATAAPQVAPHIDGAYDAEPALGALAERADVVTCEFESVPADSLAWLAEHVPVYPPPRAFARAQDRLSEKQLFRELGMPTPPFAPVDSLAALQEAVAEIGLPAVLKTRTCGYDGKGQAVLRHPDDLPAAWTALSSLPLILEAYVPFTREVSIIAARTRSGDVVFYPLAENTHRNGILRLSICRPGDPLQGDAAEYARRLLDALEYVGVLALELFDVEGALLANEFAPRVHNSGHWTIEGAETSQFENHLRAVAGLPLGDTAPVGRAAMVNLIGTIPDVGGLLAAVPNARVHLYGKAPRAGAKLGHVTLRGADDQQLQASLQQLRTVVDW